MAGPLLETKLHVPRRRRGLVARPRLSERLNRRARVGADAGVGPGRLRQDDAAGRVAGRGSCRPMAGPRRGSRSTSATTIRRCSGRYLLAALRDGGTRGRRKRAPLLQSPQPPDRSGPRHPAQRPRRRPERRRPGARRLPRHRGARGPGRDGLPAGAPAPAGTPGARQPRRPGAAAGPAARARRARRDPGRRPALHARRGRGVPQRGDGAGADGSRTSHALEGRTEGWIAALQLAALSMQGRDDVAGFIAGFAGDDRYIVDYLVEEVLQRQPEQRPQLPAADLHPEPADRLAVRRRHRPGRRQGHARGARPREPVPGPARRPPPVVSLSPSVRRRAAGAPAGRAAERRC